MALSSVFVVVFGLMSLGTLFPDFALLGFGFALFSLMSATAVTVWTITYAQIKKREVP